MDSASAPSGDSAGVRAETVDRERAARVRRVGCEMCFRRETISASPSADRAEV